MLTSNVRPPAVAGSFYPANAGELSRLIQALLDSSHQSGTPTKAIIVPHAGYIYSGRTAAAAYGLLRNSALVTRVVVMFGPAHRLWTPGLAVPTVAQFATPLGRVDINPTAIATVANLPQVRLDDAPHADEHSLEVQLPFLQTVLPEFSIVPFVVGGATPQQVAEVMAALWGGPETLIVVSSDFSHYLSYSEAQRVDRASIDDILACRPLEHHEQACGAISINALLSIAARRRMKPELLDLRNSGDTAGDRQRVVGYGAVAFSERDHA